jgi:hypothetical protein
MKFAGTIESTQSLLHNLRPFARVILLGHLKDDLPESWRDLFVVDIADDC